jgi:hypothetical protein
MRVSGLAFVQNVTLGLWLAFAPQLSLATPDEQTMPVARPDLLYQSPVDPHETAIHTLLFFDEDRKLISLDYAADAKIWEIPSGKLLLSFSVAGFANRATLDPSKNLFVSMGGGAVFIDLTTGKKLWQMQSETGVFDVDFHPKRNEVLVSEDNSMKVFDALTGRFLRELDRAAAKPQWRLQVQFTSESKFVTVSQKGVVMEWDYEKGIPLRTIAKDFLPDLVSDTIFVPEQNAVIITIGGLRPAYKVSFSDGSISTYPNPASRSHSQADDASAINDTVVFLPYAYSLKKCNLRERWDIGSWNLFGPIRISSTGKYFALADKSSWKLFAYTAPGAPNAAK